MKRYISRLAAITALGVTASILAISPAAATNQVDCDNRNDFVKVWYFPSRTSSERTVCFANAGVISPQLPYVRKFSTGNNNIQVMVANKVFTMEKWAIYKSDVAGTLQVLWILPG